MARRCGDEALGEECILRRPATGCSDTGEREPNGPYIPEGESQAWYARSRDQTGTYVSPKLATRATPEPEPTPARVGGLIAHVGTGAERP